jgi:hypothetical protein
MGCIEIGFIGQRGRVSDGRFLARRFILTLELQTLMLEVVVNEVSKNECASKAAVEPTLLDIRKVKPQRE